MNETFSIKTACPPVSIPFCRLIKRKTKIFRPFDRLVLFRLPLLPRPCWKLPGTDLELISTKRLPWLPPFFSTPVFLFPLPSFLPLFFFFRPRYPAACSSTKKFGRASSCESREKRRFGTRENKDPREGAGYYNFDQQLWRKRIGGRRRRYRQLSRSITRGDERNEREGRSVCELWQVFANVEAAPPKLRVFACC